ncbi:hypothetical protein HMPREF1583_01172 [Gardnerella vaginalis JCP8151B]|nr:hypothetical protein HMPREF1583_01172 [Gardnerella vaginalis JCP8151B]
MIWLKHKVQWTLCAKSAERLLIAARNSAANPRERCDALSSSKQRVGLQNRKIALASL